MIRLALRQGVEIPSYARGAENFTELTGVPLSESALQRHPEGSRVEYGGALAAAEEQEAEAMVRVPKEEEAVLWRQIPEPDSEIMVVSADGVMIHLRDEGWKETKVMSVSALLPVEEPAEGPRGLPEAETSLPTPYRLQQHSYRCASAKKPSTLPIRKLSTGSRTSPTGSLYQ